MGKYRIMKDINVRSRKMMVQQIKKVGKEYTYVNSTLDAWLDRKIIRLIGGRDYFPMVSFPPVTDNPYGFKPEHKEIDEKKQRAKDISMMVQMAKEARIKTLSTKEILKEWIKSMSEEKPTVDEFREFAKRKISQSKLDKVWNNLIQKNGVHLRSCQRDVKLPIPKRWRILSSPIINII